MHRCGSTHSGRRRSAWTLVLSGLAAAAIGLAVVGDARAIDRPGDARNRAAKNAAKVAPKPKALTKSNPAVVNPNRAGVQPNPGLPRGAVGNPGSNDPRHTGTTTNNPQQPHAAIDPRNRQNAATGVRNRFNPADPRSRLNAAAGPRNRLNGAADPRNRFNTASPRNGFNTAAADPRNRINGFNQRGRLNAADYRRQLLDHRRLNFLARSRIPLRPYFGERGFTGVPPVGETRYVSHEMVFHVGANVSRQAVDDLMRKHGMSVAGAESMSLTGGTMYQVRVANNQAMADVVRELEAENIGLAQPNYVFHLQRDATTEQTGEEPAQDTPVTPSEDPAPAAADAPQDTTLAARPAGGDPSQYVVSKLKLGEVHRVATGKNVLVAVIDSQVDATHPDLARSISEQYDAVGRRDKPDAHGTGMTGAIAAQRKLLGVAPGAKILAIHAFSPDASDSPQATTKHILAGLEYAIKKGARVINMSFAGPYDPVAAACDEEGARQRRGADRGRRQCRAEVTAAVSGRRSERDRRDGDGCQRQDFRQGQSRTAGCACGARRRDSGAGAQRRLSVDHRNVGRRRACERRRCAADRAQSHRRCRDHRGNPDDEREKSGAGRPR